MVKLYFPYYKLFLEKYIAFLYFYLHKYILYCDVIVKVINYQISKLTYKIIVS